MIELLYCTRCEAGAETTCLKSSKIMAVYKLLNSELGLVNSQYEMYYKEILNSRMRWLAA